MIDEEADRRALPGNGLPAERVLAEVRALRAADRPTHGGRLFAYVYDPAVPGLDELAAAAYAGSAHVNGLDPTAFPSLLAMENALVGAAARLLGGGPGSAAPDVVGSVTSGGTESLILAVKAARDAHPEITEPRIVVPASAHAAFAKAAHYLRVAVDPVPVSARTLRPAAADVAAAIGPATVLVVCSAPSYAHGVVDPVAEIARAAASAGVRCHVDACFGGWTLPYLRRLGVDVPPFDFALAGVTSISVDLHKYAYAPKGVSVLLHRDPALRAPQYFAYADWPGYTMVNPVIASTRSGGPIAAAYATLRHLGDDGYLRLAAATRDAVAGLADAVRTVDGLRLMAEPESTVVCFTATDPGLDLFVLVDELAARGWHTQPQQSYADLPRSVHLTVTAAVAPRVAEFGPDLADAVAAARAAGPVALPAELLALAGTLTPEALTPDLVAGLAAGLGLTIPADAAPADAGTAPADAGTAPAGPLPGRTAVVNTLLDAAPPALRERLLVEFVGLLQRPTW
ncbi:aminotransferase class V-fold PLP-dependent enzyme [Micromonospora peucetia]|uniref:pyridoxal phosphate-dependent decarboxylase family protein n=1 Tax=Micromonospora peucetia TaxID=47871 RepID=UPI00224F6934|nr:aminotransferase class V-fold PLP-dependent enzyme [Micromonospora peucetia]MCX4389365.1 aminotransferase class V-fold PLP-dependent enzyme [Micromonospora peucetia]